MTEGGKKQFVFNCNSCCDWTKICYHAKKPFAQRHLVTTFLEKPENHRSRSLSRSHSLMEDSAPGQFALLRSWERRTLHLLPLGSHHNRTRPTAVVLGSFPLLSLSGPAPAAAPSLVFVSPHTCRVCPLAGGPGTASPAHPAHSAPRASSGTDTLQCRVCSGSFSLATAQLPLLQRWTPEHLRGRPCSVSPTEPVLFCINKYSGETELESKLALSLCPSQESSTPPAIITLFCHFSLKD